MRCGLVALVYLVCLICLVEPDRPDEPEQLLPVPSASRGYLHDSSIQHERDFHIHAKQDGLAVVDYHVLFLHPSRFDPVDGLGYPTDSVLNGVFETLGRLSTQLDDLRDGHGTPPLLCA